MRPGAARTPTLSHDNHFVFGYRGVVHRDSSGKRVELPFSFRTSPDDEWYVRYGRCQRQPLDFRRECLETAKLIRASTKLPIDLLYSGGVDSEVVLRSFLAADIPVRVNTLRFAKGKNQHDIDWVERTCRELGLTPRYFELDVEEFWQTDADEYAERTQCVSPQLLTTMWLADQVDGYCILGSGENFIVKTRPKNYQPGLSPYLRSVWHLYEKEKVASWYRHFIARERDACPGFFQYTPELMLAWFLDPIACDLWNDRRIGKLNSASSKLEQYQQHFPIADRPKYTGFENVAAADAACRTRLREKFGGCDFMVKTPVPKLVLELAPNETAELGAISPFHNPIWNQQVDLTASLPPIELEDGRIHY